ncbi:hypothetical protein [Mycobacterium ostraviense]|uniref:Core-binding (CB) domain-containing protein n=1 Tax=Mycobacterium ostraviense TaxID=2738409 RepID=A0A162CZ52_9MYCO|nr:hypothetical protein [Mycobacterium ostraviense]KZS62555.1 hypothetical protein A4G28_08270 [Mycobacterium ostraviense]
MTVAQWVRHHIDHLTGVEQYTLDVYERYLANDIAPFLGDIPLKSLTAADIARWVKPMESTPSAKTKRLPAPKTIRDGDDMRMLSRDEFDRLLAPATAEPWRPLLHFLVASGCRWGEATALNPPMSTATPAP